MVLALALLAGLSVLALAAPASPTAPAAMIPDATVVAAIRRAILFMINLPH